MQIIRPQDVVEEYYVIQKCLLWLLISKEQVSAILEEGPDQTGTSIKPPGRPAFTLFNRVAQFHDRVVNPGRRPMQRFLALGSASKTGFSWPEEYSSRRRVLGTIPRRCRGHPAIDLRCIRARFRKLARFGSGNAQHSVQRRYRGPLSASTMVIHVRVKGSPMSRPRPSPA